MALQGKHIVSGAHQHPRMVARKSPELEELEDLQCLEGVLHSPERHKQVSLRIFWVASRRLNDEVDRKALRCVYEAKANEAAVPVSILPAKSLRRVLNA